MSVINGFDFQMVCLCYSMFENFENFEKFAILETLSLSIQVVVDVKVGFSE